MKRRKITGLCALAVATAFGVAACGGSSGTGGTSNTSNTSTYGAANTAVVNPSTATGGTFTYNLSSTPDSTDPQNTYYAFMWNFVRTYTMQLMTYKSCPGTCGLSLVPDLATAPGQVSANGLVWTYHIQPNVKFETGQVVTSQDIKYGVERTYAKSVLPNGPSYFQILLADPKYPGPYVDRAKNIMGLTSITTPNATTIQFHLQHPFADFNYVVAIAQTSPVPPAADTGAKGGANYQLHPISTGPYMFQSYTLNKQLTLVKNPNWNPATDPQAKQLVNKIVLNMNVNANTIDNNLLANYADIDMDGTGVQTAARSKILTNPTLKNSADDALSGFLWFAYINSKVIPNVHCREAIEYAADKVTLQDAYGGPLVGGTIASTIMPPNIVGYQKFDDYNATSDPNGDAAAAKTQLGLCGKAGGFSTDIAYRSDRPKEVAAATALQQALSQVGIKTTLAGFPSGKYYTDFAGSPAYVHTHDLGISFGGWAADWPDGFGFLYYLSDGTTIAPAGNTNIAEINTPGINNLFNQAAGQNNATARNAIWPEIDHQIMGGAYMLPIVYAKSLLYRNPNVTNVYVDDYYGMYNYAVLGLK
jgi:peptide/nickel transport system substrate-binding protein